MEIAYTPVPMRHNLEFISVSSRILTTNLLRNKNITPEFSSSCLYTSLCDIRYNELYPYNSSICHMLGLSNFMFMMDNMPSDEYRDNIIKIKSEIVLLGVFHLLELIAVMHLLNDNRKVAIGGPMTILYSSEFLRRILIKMGSKNVYDNLIVINGYVDLTTDIYSIIKEWKDVKIESNNIKTIWDCNDDFLQSLIRIKERVKPIKQKEWWDDNHVLFALNLKCFWGKCKFCAYKKMPICDFRDEPDIIIRSIKETMHMYDKKVIRFCDSYFEFDSNNIRVLDGLKDEFKIQGVFLGILSLLKKENIYNVNKYLRYFLTGVECFSNNTLNVINKGYNLNHFYKSIDNIIKYLDREVVIDMFIIGDLPMKNIDDVKSSYDEAVRIKKILVKEGFRVRFRVQPLQVNPLVELEDSLIMGDNSIPSGINKLIEHFRDKGVSFFDKIEDDSVIKDIFIPYHRGFESDFDIISSDKIGYLTQWEKGK